jgi:hypothetical protein
MNLQGTFNQLRDYQLLSATLSKATQGGVWLCMDYEYVHLSFIKRRC